VRPYLVGVGIAVLVAVIGAFAGSIPFVLLGVVVAFAIFAVSSLAMSKVGHEDEMYDDLSPDSRILIKPLKKIYNEISETRSISPYLVKEALDESKRLLQQSTQALLLRDRLVRESRGRYEAEKSIGDLQNRMSSATSDDEKISLKSALDARNLELGHYEQLKQGVAKIESSVKQAEAAMAEMRARLVSSASAGIAEEGSDPLREAVGRMQALSTSLSEAQEMLQK
jgi:hypothetical protein